MGAGRKYRFVSSTRCVARYWLPSVLSFRNARLLGTHDRSRLVSRPCASARRFWRIRTASAHVSGSIGSFHLPPTQRSARHITPHFLISSQNSRLVLFASRVIPPISPLSYVPKERQIHSFPSHWHSLFRHSGPWHLRINSFVYSIVWCVVHGVGRCVMYSCALPGITSFVPCQISRLPWASFCFR